MTVLKKKSLLLLRDFINKFDIDVFRIRMMIDYNKTSLLQHWKIISIKLYYLKSCR